MNLYQYYNKPNELYKHNQAGEFVYEILVDDIIDENHLNPKQIKFAVNNMEKVLDDVARHNNEHSGDFEGYDDEEEYGDQEEYEEGNYDKRDPITIPQLEPYIIKKPDLIFLYARDVLGKRWPAGERVLANDSDYAYTYASQVVDGRWPAGEDAIAKSPQHSMDYAAHTIHGRFPKGEKAILRGTNQPEYDVYIYSTYALNGQRWPEGEKVIIANKSKASNKATSAAWYAIKILNDKWPEVEHIIKTDDVRTKEYNEFLKEKGYSDSELI